MSVRRSLPALALLTAALVTGCSSADQQASGGGPLNGPDYADAGSGEECIPAKKGGSVAFGGDELHNYGSKAVTIDRVTLSKASGLRLVEAVIVSNSTALIGYGSGWPPDPEARSGPGIDWAHRRKAAGATLAPQPDNAKVANNLVLHLQVTAASGVHMAGVLVDYHVGSSEYVWHNVLGLTVETKKKSC
ncbi:hypothetical protein [Streptomyces prunicolor]|uniref:Lipoprotein n=1 Tax=Streptomyces prunicolor TaxID=67348 RepID=A0ABU4F2P7_9ACTN|nr:hypothetical protein [Streptomyces prunicolor]MDV7214870.1 hypothetical protein [Streptomyces prunicolor]